jgi:hypothetical protein
MATCSRGLQAPGFLNCIDQAREMALSAWCLTGRRTVSGPGGVRDQRCRFHDCGTLRRPKFNGLRPTAPRGFASLSIGTGCATPQGGRVISVGHFISVGHLSTSLGCGVTASAVKSPIRPDTVNCFISTEIIPASKESSTGDQTSHHRCLPHRSRACMSMNSGPATSNDNVANDDRCTAISLTPAPAGYFMTPDFFLHPPTASF